MAKIRSIALLAWLLSILIFLFGNCSDVQLQRKDSSGQNDFLRTQPVQKICAPQGEYFSSPLMFSFILDMSFSNVGRLNASYADPSNLLRMDYSIIDPEGGADPEGQRFRVLREFIESCGKADNVNYAIMGFGESMIHTTSQSCLSPFIGPAQALESVDNFKAMQDYDRSNPNFFNSIIYPYNLQQGTSYLEALRCLSGKVIEDVVGSPQESRAHYGFLITDGMPAERGAMPPGLTEYVSVINDLRQDMDVLGQSPLQFHTVFYTRPGAANQGQAVEALPTLRAISEAAGPESQTFMVDEVGDMLERLCSLVEPKAHVRHSLLRAYAVNLTATRVKGRLVADSDMDGLSDEDEIQTGLDPLNPRSNGKVLDTLCQRHTEQCKEFIAESDCRADSRGLGLTECDLHFARRIYGAEVNGLDSDKDLLVDYIELIRGTNPLRDDKSNYPFADGVSNFEKVISGLDLYSSQYLHPVAQENRIKLINSEIPDQCSGDLPQYQIILEQTPLVPVKAFRDESGGIMDLSHDENENVILIFSIWQPIGNINRPLLYYVQRALIDLNGRVEMGELLTLGEVSR